MSPWMIKRLFPNASEETIRQNAKDYGDSNPSHTWPTTKLERDPEPQPLETPQAQKAGPARVHICFESVRKRLCDPDNLSEKWLCDCLRYCGAIAGDEPDKITIETKQRKAEKGEEEATIIKLSFPDAAP